MKNKLITPPKKYPLGVYHSRTHGRAAKKILLLSVLFFALLPVALLLTTCGGGSVPPAEAAKYTTTVSGTVTASSASETLSIDLPGAMVSALTTPADPANRPVTSRPDGAFTLQVKHSGSFKLKIDNTCSEPFTSAAVTASADGTHNAGALKLTLKPEPAGTARYSFTEKSAGKFKLTVNNCVREIGSGEFASNGTIIRAKATAEGVNATSLITEIDLPPTLKKIGSKGLFNNFSISGTLRIPRNFEIILERGLISAGSSQSDGYTLSFEAGAKLKSIGISAFQANVLKDFRFPENLETISSNAFRNARFLFSTRFSTAGTLIIPAKVAKIGDQAFRNSQGITAVDIRSRQLAKPAGALAADFPLQRNLFQNVTGITEIKLPAEVYDSYTKAQLQAIFGSAFTNYRRPDGTAYDFATKS